ncbi:MAG: hypothetical protein HC882_00390 [Acidobacteria bacterium]|nr:hypothetical protein [Acidobacteriota bacterium]
MLAPLDRFDGSEHTLIFRGGVILAGQGVTPVPYGEAPTASLVGVPVNVSFLMADPSNTANTSRRLPGVVYDDNVGGAIAGVPPHAAANDRVWAQNSDVVVRSLNGTVTNATFVTWGYDATTGIPFFTLSMTFSAFAALATDQQVEIQVWIRPTDVR